MPACFDYPRLALVAAILAAAAPAARAGDVAGTDFSSGFWSGRAWADDSGKFVDCYVGVSYTNGETLTLSFAADDTLTVYLSSPQVAYTPGRTYDASLMTEVGLPITGKAFGSNETYVGFTLTGIDAAMDYLSQGSYMRLLGVSIDQAFDVRGLGGAMAQAKACHQAQTAGAATAAAEPATDPAQPALGSSGTGAKPVQMSGKIGSFRGMAKP